MKVMSYCTHFQVFNKNAAINTMEKVSPEIGLYFRTGYQKQKQNKKLPGP
jgi:hypothetical protein